MRRDAGGIRLSAHDLMQFTACSHATRLDMAWLDGDAELVPSEDSELNILLKKHGIRHEAAYLARLETEGRQIVRIETETASFGAAVDATLDALQAGPDIIFQGALKAGMWGGYADFLERVDAPSRLGEFSYEVVDTKLKHKAVPSHLLQLVLYSDLVAEVQGRAPEHAYVELGTGERAGFRLSQYSDYARVARGRLEAFVREPESTRPVPCSHCGICRWREHCAQEWRASDSVFLIAGINRSQVAKLEAAGVDRIEALARHSAQLPGLAAATLRKLRQQARLQHARKTGGPAFELRPFSRGKGFDLMPRPDDGDLFFDLECDPFRSEADSVGLAFLHGLWDGQEFTALWAHDAAQEREALGKLFRRLHAHFNGNPLAHIYHYGPREVATLRRLASRHGVGETTLDCWLGERRFVDLAAVVRGGMVVSEPSYELADIEAFYRPASGPDSPAPHVAATGNSRLGATVGRGADTADATRRSARGADTTGTTHRFGRGELVAGAVLPAYDAWRETGDESIFAEIDRFVRDRCRSIEGLRDWLLGIRPDRPWLEMGLGKTEAYWRDKSRNKGLVDRLDGADLPRDRKRTLYNLAVYHWRESKPRAWSVFDSQVKDFDDLCDDLECLAGLVAINGAASASIAATASAESSPGGKRAATGAPAPASAASAPGVHASAQDADIRIYRYPPQETKLREGGTAQFESNGELGSVRIVSLDRSRREIGLKQDWNSTVELPRNLDLLPDFALDSQGIPGAIRKVVDDQCGPGRNRAADDFLARRAPRFRGASPLPPGPGVTTLDALIAAARALDGSVLPVQGPPGTGKTFAAVQAILALVGDGKRIAVSSNSHEAIRNVLMGCARALAAGRGRLESRNRAGTLIAEDAARRGQELRQPLSDRRTDHRVDPRAGDARRPSADPRSGHRADPGAGDGRRSLSNRRTDHRADPGVGDVRIVHKVSRATGLSAEVRKAIACVTSNHDPAIRDTEIVGGTAWLFSREEHQGAFDYLFVDEAGQVSLADLLAMSNAAKNLVLIGDSRQLPQVVQGTHPWPANLSCLDWVLGEGRNVDPERGVFLPETWRMHPDICAYISSQFYEERLSSHPSTALQSIETSESATNATHVVIATTSTALETVEPSGSPSSGASGIVGGRRQFDRAAVGAAAPSSGASGTVSGRNHRVAGVETSGSPSSGALRGRADRRGARQGVADSRLPSSGAWWMPVAHEGRAQACPEELEAIQGVIERLLAGFWTNRHGQRRRLGKSDIIVVAPYNAQVNLLTDGLPGIRVGTVDKFQGQEAPVSLVSMTASSSMETSVGLDFLLSRERLNVAVSRGKCLSLVFASPRLLHARCATVEQMRLVNALCALPDASARGTVSPLCPPRSGEAPALRPDASARDTVSPQIREEER